MSHVLLVEDDAVNRAVVADIFQFDSISAELVWVESGEDALESVRESKPILILMDIGLPGIDGLETTRRLKQDPELIDIPIWAITAHAMKGNAEVALEAGCSRYITKPIDIKNVADEIRTFLIDVKGATCTNC